MSWLFPGGQSSNGTGSYQVCSLLFAPAVGATGTWGESPSLHLLLLMVPLSNPKWHYLMYHFPETWLNFLPRSPSLTTEWQVHSKLRRRKDQRRNPGKCYQFSDPDLPGPHMTKEESAYIPERKCDLCFSLQRWGGELVSSSRKWLVTWSRKNNAEDIKNPRKIFGWSRNCTDNHMPLVTIESLTVAIHFKFLKNGQASAQATDHSSFLDSSCASYFSATCTM